ncbi:cytochrome b/b6 domain-containing protein [Hymenobacter sp. BT491]|uniref:cytochrome b/b6 domain-containing protein n=1 Tax=Hymenobacter sp. BT491 TaxID=2766779 RepID=UPI00165371D7|nr:cytochrome b/b6 domain-containing protein [Hymenobacter sp. BT491]MBC6988110.1 cytochrome b/b6 domain-containing protein [Hymenobacter sp. BT491]
MPVQQASSAAVAQKKYSLAMRIWHWSNTFVVSSLLTTIFFLFVVLKMKTVGPAFQEALQKTGVTVTLDQARSLTRIVSHRIWDWHIYLGLTLAVLLLFRTLMEFMQPAAQRFSRRLQEAKQHYRERGADIKDARHSLLVKYSYVVFYIMLAVMVITGLLLVYADDVEALHKIEHTVKEVHNFNMYLIIAFVAAHIVGVVWAEVTKNKGIVSGMINGDD